MKNVTKPQFLPIFHRDSMDFHPIANWRSRGESTCNYASFCIDYYSLVREIVKYLIDWKIGAAEQQAPQDIHGQLSIWLILVPKNNVYGNDAESFVDSPPVIQFEIR